MQTTYHTFRRGPNWSQAGPQGGGMLAPLQGGASPSQAALGAGFQGNTPGLALDAFLYPPPNSQTLLGTDFQPSVGAGTLTALPATAITALAGQIGVVNSINILLDNITVTSNVVWQLLVGGVVAPGYSNLKIIPRSGAAAVSVIYSPVRVVLNPGVTAVLQAVNLDGAAYNIGGQLYGWMWPYQAS